jgi:hypothetical protein
VTFLNLHDFLTNKSFVFSIGFGEKSKKSQALRMTKGWGTHSLWWARGLERGFAAELISRRMEGGLRHE